MQYELIQGDCIEILQSFDDDVFDSIVTDPPYGLEFMGKSWDSYTANGYQDWCERWATECLRVLKPGGFLLAFGGTRTYHRLACAIEDAGFEIRDSLDWIYGSGFPKSLDVSKAIDKQAGAEREKIPATGGLHKNANLNDDGWCKIGQEFPLMDGPAPATEDAKAWAGWGTALKPAHEPIVMARKPLSAKTVAANVLEFGTGGINIDDCRVGTDAVTTHSRGRNTAFPKRPGETSVEESGRTARQDGIDQSEREGRWPPNVILSQESAEEMDRQSGINKSGDPRDERGKGGLFAKGTNVPCGPQYGDLGGASRFFPVFKYQAKAPKKERPQVDGIASHPTVKPVALMQWLVRLVTPYGGYVLDPFAGTGTTAEACELEGFDCLLIERDPDSARLIEKRMEKAK